MSKTLDRLSKILNQAERAPEGSPEREAFMEKALALSQAANIDLAIARSHQAKKEKPEEPEERRYKVGEITNGRVQRSRNAHFVDLMIAICRANDLEVLIGGGNVYVYAFGMPSDHEVAERLFALLSVQMVTEADAGLKRGDNKVTETLPKTRRVEIPYDERAWGQWEPKAQRWYCDQGEEDENEVYNYRTDRWGKPHVPPSYRLETVLDDDGRPVMEEKLVSAVDGRAWRANFYAGFVNRTQTRLREAKRRALKAAGVDLKDSSNERGLAIIDKQKHVREAFEVKNRTVLDNVSSGKAKSYEGAQVRQHDWSAHEAGTAAADRARLGDERDVAAASS